MTTVTKVLIGVGGLIVIVGGILLYRNYQNKETTTTPTPTTEPQKPKLKKVSFINKNLVQSQTVSKNRPTI
tara:strand:+ start:502 stop:714 length:213 start_codon:yes stop_codon:yes gene_type:complete